MMTAQKAIELTTAAEERFRDIVLVDIALIESAIENCVLHAASKAVSSVHLVELLDFIRRTEEIPYFLVNETITRIIEVAKSGGFKHNINGTKAYGHIFWE